MISTARGRRYVLAAAVLWSLSGAITKSLDLDGLTIAFYRGLFAGLVLLPFVPRSRRVFRPVMVPLGLVFGAMTGLFLAAMKATTAANAIFLQYTATFWVVPLGLLFLGERPDRRALAGIGLAMVGIGGDRRLRPRRRPASGRGVALGLASGVAYAGVVIGMRGLRELDPVWLSAVNNLAGAVALGAWMTLTHGPARASRPPPQAARPGRLRRRPDGDPLRPLRPRPPRGRRPEAGLIALIERRQREHARDVDCDVAGADHDNLLGLQVHLEAAVVGVAVVPGDEFGRRV